MRIGRIYRNKITDLIARKGRETPDRVFVSFEGLSSEDMNALRRQVKSAGGSILISKNTLILRAFKNSGVELPEDVFKGPTGVAFSGSDPVSLCKALFNFSKEKEGLKVKAGVIDNKVLDTGGLSRISKLPSKEVLRGMVVNALAGPIVSFARGLNQIILKFIWAIEEIKKQREK